MAALLPKKLDTTFLWLAKREGWYAVVQVTTGFRMGRLDALFRTRWSYCTP